MQELTFPRFTAEATLYKSHNYLKTLRNGSNVMGKGFLIPQMMRINEPCIRGCICVTQDGCPCCDSLF